MGGTKKISVTGEPPAKAPTDAKQDMADAIQTKTVGREGATTLDYAEGGPTSQEKEKHSRQSSKSARKRDLLVPGDDCIPGLKISSKLGQGGFGQVFKAWDMKENIHVAVKVEPAENGNPGRKMEWNVMQMLQAKQHCPKVYNCGLTDTVSYVVMQCLGRNLSTVRRRCVFEQRRFSLNAAFRVTADCIEAIWDLHKVGFVHRFLEILDPDRLKIQILSDPEPELRFIQTEKEHTVNVDTVFIFRDIKPSNFAIGVEKKTERQIYLIDYGIGRAFLSGDGTHKPERTKGSVGFRGTTRYASVASHDGDDLSRRDDLWSLFYTFIELLSGVLPWRHTNDKSQVAAMKKQFPPEVFCRAMVPEVRKFVGHVRQLSFLDEPNYEQCINFFQTAINGLGYKKESSYDWQLKECGSLPHWKPPAIP